MSIAETTRLQFSSLTQPVNIAERLMQTAAKLPSHDAVIIQRRLRGGSYQYSSRTFADLAEDVRRISTGLRNIGIAPGQRIVLMVRPSADFVALTFALFRIGAVTVLIDPGMGKKNLLDCLEAVNPDGFVAIPLAQAARIVNIGRFPNAKLNVTVGRRWFWGGPTLADMRAHAGNDSDSHLTEVHDPAAIIFTTGSTGPPKGVLYSHGNFQAQVDQIRDRYEIEPGGVDLACFPLFGLFNGAMGTTTVIPDMDASRPARVNPKNIVHAIQEHACDQSFASPAVWHVVGKYCDENDIELPTLKLVLSAGAPVPVDVLKRLRRTIHFAGETYTPYGATESLPVASVSASQLLAETAAKTAAGAGTCVGSKFKGIEWRVIEIDDDPIASIEQTRPLPPGEIGELIVRGPQVTSRYVTREDQNALHKISDGDGLWHRIGDVGYLDDEDRFWFCGRKAHRVETAHGTMYTVPCESVSNAHPQIYRSALVGVGGSGNRTPVMICEALPQCRPVNKSDRAKLIQDLHRRLVANRLTAQIEPQHILLHKSFPVDIRHNAKIVREQLAVWAARILRNRKLAR